MLRIANVLTLLAAGFVAAFGVATVSGQTPVPTQTLTATPAPSQTVSTGTATPAPAAQTPVAATGLRHSLQVRDRTASGPARDGATVVLTRRLSREELAEIQRRCPPPGPCAPNTGPQPCATLTVAAGRVEAEPVFTADCPEGTDVLVSVDYNDEKGTIGARVDPPIEWRRARAGEMVRSGTIVPIQPPTAGEQHSNQVNPPNTGEGMLSRESNVRSAHWGYAALAASLVLGVLSLLLGFMSRTRRVR